MDEMMSDVPWIQRAIRRYNKQGVTIRRKTNAECRADIEAMEVPKQVQLPYEVRLKQVHEIIRIIKEEKLTHRQACDKVGLPIGNFKKLRHQFKIKID